MSRRLIVLFALAVVAILVTLVYPGGETRGTQVRRELLPDLELEVRARRGGGLQHVGPDWTPPARDRLQVPPEGVPVTEEELETLRAEARSLAPRGREMGRVAPMLALPAPSAPRRSRKFNALHFGQSGGFVPPDTQIAVGPGHVLQAVNAAVQLSNQRGRRRIRQTAAEHFGLDEDAFIFDPKTYYDPMSKRFFLLFLERSLKPRRSFILLSVSRSPRPGSLGDDDWCKYRFKSKKGATWADYPGLGMNEDWVAVSTNNFKFKDDSFKQSLFWIIDKALADNASGCPKLSVFRVGTRKDGQGRTVFNPQPAQHQTASTLAGNPLLAVNTQFLGFSNQYVLWRIGGAATRADGRLKPRVTREMVSAPQGYAFPPEATQKGGAKSLDAGDVRVMQQLVFADGQLWLVHGSGCQFGEGQDAETFGCVRVARIVPADDAAAVDFEDLFGLDGHYLFWPGIGVTRAGDVVAAFHVAGATRRLSTAYNGLKNGAARFGPITRLDDVFDRIRTLSKGKCPTELPTSGELVRTGDYLGVSPDPKRNDMWISGEFAKRVSGTCAWATQVARVGY